MYCLQVCDGRKLKDITGVSGQETPLLAQGVSDGSTLVMFKRRMPPTNPDVGQITHPSLEQIERVVRTEAERQGREVVAPAQPAESNRGIAPLETRLHDIMQVHLALHDQTRLPWRKAKTLQCFVSIHSGAEL